MRFVLLAAVLIPISALADVPSTIGVGGIVVQGSEGFQFSYQGGAVFRLYDDPVGGSLIWEEQQASVTVDGGLFQVELGGVTAFVPSTFSGARWLEIDLTGGPGKLSPRTPLTAVPYALACRDAQSIGGMPVADLAMKADTEAALAKKADRADLKYVSGSRLKARYYSGEDGARQFKDWWDTTLDTACTFYNDPDGEPRCQPISPDSNYPEHYDSGCNKKVLVLNHCNPAQYIIAYDDSADPARWTYYKTGEKFLGTAVYWRKLDGTCGMSSSITNEYRTSCAYYYGPEVPYTQFAKASLIQDP